MALIRLVSHFKNNPKHIDKMIAIKGLPEEWIFREGSEGKELVHPWKADVDKNIPFDIRHLCEPTYVTFRYPPIEKGRDWVIEKKQILGLVLDFMTEPGRELWEKIDRYIENTIPRNERVPEPVVLSKDEHSIFETYLPKRSSTGSLYLEPSPIPEIDLNLYNIPVVRKEISPTLTPEAPKSDLKVAVQEPPKIYTCDTCQVTFDKERALRMHKMKKHPNKEKVGAT